MSIKYYHLANGEELPEEFCAIRDEGGEPNGYVFYVPESEVAKLRKLVRCLVYATHPLDRATLIDNAAELGLEMDG